METRSTSALFKRAEQLRRWEESETNRASDILNSGKKNSVQFTEECVFLAACSSCDKDEVKRLLSKGANIDTANVDGLTALHQSCIDDNYDMVEFLVEHGADVNCGDNEGWTPLHATASCGFVSIANYLIDNGANVAAVNNDGELPLDIAESEDMEELLQHEIDKRGIDCDLARKSEEHMMMEDAKQMLNSNRVDEKRHPKTGATALHVAAAKGYIEVMSILIQAGFDINAQDYDGWTPLHAAAHWGQAESCGLIVDELCDMDVKNYSGQYALDVADPDVMELLEELRKKQIALRRERPELQSIMDRRNPPPFKRRTSVTRMSGSDKTNAIMKDKNQERAQIETTLQVTEKVSPINSNESESEESSSEVTSSSEDSEVESTSSSKSVDSDKSSNSESEGSLEKRNKANIVENNKELIGSRENVNDVKPKEPIKNRENREPPSVQAPPMPPKVEAQENDDDAPSWRRAVKKVSGGPTTNSIDTPTVNRNSEPNEEVVLRSSSGSRNSTNDKEAEPKREGQRPASAEPSKDDRLTSLLLRERYQRPKSLPIFSDYASQLVSGDKSASAVYDTRTTRVRSMVAAFTERSSGMSKREEPPKKERPHAVVAPVVAEVAPPVPVIHPPVPSPVVPLPPTLTVAIGVTAAATTTTITPATPTLTTTPGTPTISSTQIRRSFVPPVRDEESETQRKAHAKRVRETRRSTQGVTLEDLKSAEQLVQKKGSDTEIDPQKAATVSAAAPPPPEAVKAKDATLPSEEPRTTAATVERRPSWRVRLEQDESKTPQDDSPLTRRLSNDVSATVTLAPRLAAAPPPPISTADPPPYTRLSRPTSTTPAVTVTGSTTTTATSASSAAVATSNHSSAAAVDADTTVTFTIKARPASKVQSEEEDLKEQDKENEESKSNTQATQATIQRRRRPKRRSTGVVYLDGLEDGDSEKVDADGERTDSRVDNKNESDEQAKQAIGDRGYRSSRYGSTSSLSESGSRAESRAETPSRLSERSAERVSRASSVGSTAATTTQNDAGEKDYKKLYEEQKLENDRLIDKLKKSDQELEDAKSQLEKASQNNARNSASDTERRERRALERKLSEMEEELKQLEPLRTENQRLRDENGALIRVISKLSK